MSLHRIAIIAAALVAAVQMPALAVTTPPDETAITDNAFSNAVGVVRVNLAAGNGNAQANSLIIGDAHTNGQTTQTTTAQATEDGTTAIGDFAFSGTIGVVQINQSSGAGNAQANMVLVRLDDTALSNELPQQSTHADVPQSSGKDAVSVAKTAFTNAKGLVQLDQAAGAGNSTSNTFVLQVQSLAGH